MKCFIDCSFWLLYWWHSYLTSTETRWSKKFSCCGQLPNNDPERIKIEELKSRTSFIVYYLAEMFDSHSPLNYGEIKSGQQRADNWTETWNFKTSKELESLVVSKKKTGKKFKQRGRQTTQHGSISGEAFSFWNVFDADDYIVFSTVSTRCSGRSRMDLDRVKVRITDITSILHSTWKNMGFEVGSDCTVMQNWRNANPRCWLIPSRGPG